MTEIRAQEREKICSEPGLESNFSSTNKLEMEMPVSVTVEDASMFKAKLFRFMHPILLKLGRSKITIRPPMLLAKSIPLATTILKNM